MLRTRTLVLSLTVLSISVFAGQTLRGQGYDPVATRLGLTRSTGSLPGWTKPPAKAVQALTRAVKTVHPGVMLIGTAQGHGTGFVISRKHRLVATNAHVADILHANGSMLAIRNGSAEVYKVDRVWYHPGVMRHASESIILRRQDPKDGEVHPRCPDVAVLHLADGPDLLFEFELATVQDVDDCFAQPVGMLGYPGHDTEGWPGIGEKAEATLREGIICRLSDFYGNVNVSKEQLQFLQHSMTSWFGFSGSPLFLQDGRVIAINNSSRAVKKGAHQIQIAFAIRIDCLWELLAYHKLDSQVPVSVSRARLALDRFERQSQQEKDYIAALKLVREAEYLVTHRDWSTAIAKCTSAISLCPSLAEAYKMRAWAYAERAHLFRPDVLRPGSRASAEAIRFRERALADSKKRLQLEPTDSWAMFHCAQALSQHQMALGNTSRRTEIIDMLTRMLDSAGISDGLRSAILVERACQKANTRNNARLKQNILSDFATAIRLDPFSENAYNCRAQFLNSSDPADSATDRRRLRELRTAAQANADAWKLATSPSASERNGRRGQTLALQACRITDYAYWKYVDTLAAACAECGEFGKATRWAEESIKLAPPEERPTLRERLRQYQNKDPYRDE